MAQQNLFSYETFVRAIAGATGSIISMSVFYPLDTVRFRMQLEDEHSEYLKTLNTFQAVVHILKKEGFEALYRGVKPVLQSLGASNFVYFYTFHGLKKAGSGYHDLALGIIAGIANVLTTLPLWVVNSRLKIEKPIYYSGLLDGLVHIANTEGVSALWNGVGPSLMLVINPAIQFTIYEALKRRIPVRGAGAFFILGAIAKACATIATYPIQLAQTKQRHGINSNVSTAALLLSILKRSGPAGLFQGLEAKLLQTVLTAALMFVSYEKIVRFVFSILLNNKHKLKA
ncbi:peroxisomal membrane protein PMP34 [Atheta coriaria]|uniref:peroxisomal membrane protein PMP34 n=1 Tax=Dalotia coriaria TaxID=877792 RepID=UPI0031F39711